MALSTRRKKILAWYLLEASNEFLRTLLEKVVDEEPLLDERSLRKRRPRRHEEEGDKLVQALLLCSADQRLLRRLIADRLKRRFWAAPRGDAVRESQFLGTFRVVGFEYGCPDWEDKEHMEHLWLTKDNFFRLHARYGCFVERQVTRFRLPVSSQKRIALTLHFLAHGGSFSQVALLYGIGKSTAWAVIVDTIAMLKEQLVKQSISFPKGEELVSVINDFENLAGVPQCAGAIDGTFMHIVKPKVFDDSYWCYKNHLSILILAVVDARGVFTYVNAGSPGSVGDASAYNTSLLARNVVSRRWLGSCEKVICGKTVYPFLVGDSAFALSNKMMKCFEDSGHLLPRQETFNYQIIRTRRVVEQAFGRLKGRFQVLTKNHITDPSFARDVALVCCALHNVCERWQCPFESGWLIDPKRYAELHPGPNEVINHTVDLPGVQLRKVIAQYLHRRKQNCQL